MKVHVMCGVCVGADCRQCKAGGLVTVDVATRYDLSRLPLTQKESELALKWFTVGMKLYVSAKSIGGSAPTRAHELKLKEVCGGGELNDEEVEVIALERRLYDLGYQFFVDTSA